MTPEEAMKWDAVEPRQGVHTYERADVIAQFARRLGIKVRGHTLVFDQSRPAWLDPLSDDQKQAALQAHVTDEVTHFKGKVYQWDVVNEAFDTNGNVATNNFWYRAFANGVCQRDYGLGATDGSCYIDKAFAWARAAADSATKLYLNERHLDGHS